MTFKVNIMYLIHTKLKNERKIIIKHSLKTLMFWNWKNTYNNLLIINLVGVLY